MAWTTDQLTALETAIAAGSKEVRYGDKHVIYNSLDEMMRLRRTMRIELGLETGHKKYFSKFSKGL